MHHLKKWGACLLIFMNTKRLVTLALFSTIALTIFMIESSLPTLAPIPGIKLGLANIITLFLIVNYSNKDSFLVLIVRIILASIFTGQMMSFLYSLCGGILCFLSMSIMNRIFKSRYIYLTSIIGAIFHNIGQITVAVIILHSAGVLAYLPLLMISAIITGLFTGLCTHFLTRKFPNFLKL